MHADPGMRSLAVALAAAIAAERAYIAVLDPSELRFVASSLGQEPPGAVSLDRRPSLRRLLVRGAPAEDAGELADALAGSSRLVLPLSANGRRTGAAVIVDAPMPPAAATEMLAGALPLAAAHLETWLESERLRAAAGHLLDIEGVRGFAASTQDAVRIVDLDGRVLSWNAGAQRLYGWSEDEVVGEVLPSTPPEARPMLLADLRRMAMTMEPFEREVTQVRKDGSHLRAMAFVRPVFDEDGQVLGVCLSREARAQGGELAGDAFCDLVSDSLRNPLAAISGFAQLLRRQEILDDPVRRRRALDALEAHSVRMSLLVDDLLLLSGASEGSLCHEPGPVDLVGLVTDVVGEYDKGEHRFVVDVEARLPGLLADGQRVRQALGHLIANATTYGPPDGSIWVSVTRHGDDAVVSVRDEGDGIPADDLDHIFDRFTRGSQARGHGTGIGLYAVRLIAEAHGGSASVTCEPEAGCTAILRLPLPS